MHFVCSLLSSGYLSVILVVISVFWQSPLWCMDQESQQQLAMSAHAGLLSSVAGSSSAHNSAVSTAAKGKQRMVMPPLVPKRALNLLGNPVPESASSTSSARSSSSSLHKKTRRSPRLAPYEKIISQNPLVVEIVVPHDCRYANYPGMMYGEYDYQEPDCDRNFYDSEEERNHIALYHSCGIRVLYNDEDGDGDDID